MRDTPELGQPLGIEHVKELLARVTGDRRAGTELSVSQIHQVHEDPALQKELQKEVARCIRTREEIVPYLIPLLSPKSLDAIHADKELQTLIRIHINNGIEHGEDIRYGYQECLSKESLDEIQGATMKVFDPKLTHPDVVYIPKRYAHFFSESSTQALQTAVTAHLLQVIGAGNAFSPILLSTLTDENFEKVRAAVQEKISKTGGGETLPPIFNEVVTLSKQTRDNMILCEEIFWKIRRRGALSESEKQAVAKLSPQGINYLRDRSLEEISRVIRVGLVIPESILFLLEATGTEAPQDILMNYFTADLHLWEVGSEDPRLFDTIARQYFELLSPQSRAEMHRGHKFLEKALSLIRYGKSLRPFLAGIASFHTFDRAALTPEILRSALEDSLRAFFHSSISVGRRVKDFVAQLDDQTVRRALLDKTLTPLGLKFHTERNSPLTDAFTGTGGFVAHEQNSCFVTPVAVNEIMLGLCSELFNQTVGTAVVPTPGSNFSFLKGYVQVTFPQRLSNEYCSVGTVAYLLSHSLREVKAAILTNNQVAARATIYDAGTTVKHSYIPTKDGTDFIYDGRTDYMVAKTWKDIERAHTIHTLLLHASDSKLAFHELGNSFIKDFRNILLRHDALGLLDSKTFVHGAASTEAEDREYADILNLISERKTNDARDITNSVRIIEENTVTARDISSPATYAVDPNERKRKVGAAYERISQLLTKQVSTLIDDYRAKLYPDGVYTNELDS